MQIYGREVDFKVSRLKDAGNLDMAMDNMEKTEKELIKHQPASAYEAYRNLISMLRTFFVDATGVDVLAECEDAEEAKDTYFDFLRQVNAQKVDVSVSLTDIK